MPPYAEETAMYRRRASNPRDSLPLTEIALALGSASLRAGVLTFVLCPCLVLVFFCPLGRITLSNSAAHGNRKRKRTETTRRRA